MSAIHLVPCKQCKSQDICSGREKFEPYLRPKYYRYQTRCLGENCNNRTKYLYSNAGFTEDSVRILWNDINREINVN